MDPIVTPMLTFGLGLAKAAISFMKARQEDRMATQTLFSQARLAQEEHDFQMRMQEARLKHELLIESIRARNADSKKIVVMESSKSAVPYMRVEVPDDIPGYLNTEAELLCDQNFDVTIDQVSEGYALALVIRSNLTIAFWLPGAYPNTAPSVFAITPSEREQIHFDNGAWTPERHLVEVVDALKNGY